MSGQTEKRLTGGGVLAILLAAFGVVIGANLALAFFATGSFPGLVVGNSYVASQGFDAEREAIAGRGWRTAAVLENGLLRLRVSDRAGRPVSGLSVSARLGRPAAAETDREVLLSWDGQGYVAPLALAPGRWRAAFAIDDGSGAPVVIASLLTRGTP